jgi:hypothetical protein
MELEMEKIRLQNFRNWHKNGRRIVSDGFFFIFDIPSESPFREILI